MEAAISEIPNRFVESPLDRRFDSNHADPIIREMRQYCAMAS
jgi:hypothetical protein